MSSRHPVDSLGRSLPPCDWPADRIAPAPLEIVRRFCNTTNLESGADRLHDPNDFGAWLAEQGHDVFIASQAEIDRCIAVREALRSASVAHREGRSDRPELGEVARLLHGIGFAVTADDDGFRTVVDPLEGPSERFVGTLALAVIASRSDSSWVRLKACRNCRWVVFDGSKNRSGQWCSMSACGGRSKVREHRARLRSDAARSDRAIVRPFEREISGR